LKPPPPSDAVHITPQRSFALSLSPCSLLYYGGWRTIIIIHTNQDIVSCAMTGPFNDVPAIELSVMATRGIKWWPVAHGAHNLRITSDFLSPFSSQVFPGTVSSADRLVEFLHHKQGKGRLHCRIVFLARQKLAFSARWHWP
jgi:hypothetical protein